MIGITSVQAMKESAAHKKIVLVGTYWTGQFSKWRGYYNYPIDEAVEVDPEAYGDICELWLFRGKQYPLYRTAKFIGVKTKSELVSEYKYKPQKGSQHKKYLLFKTAILYAPSETADKVIVRLSDFVKRSPKVWAQLKAYLESSDRTNPKLAARLPRILNGIPPERLCVCEAALEYDYYPIVPCLNPVNAPIIDPDFKRDVQESDIPEDVLKMLLKDQTTGNNILWMTDNYVKYESLFDAKMGPRDQILVEEVNRPGTKIIRPRVDKSREEQRARVVGKAEVFTPSWICNAMNNLMDAAWFGLKKSPFTIEGHKSWKANKERIPFPGKDGGDWQTFVREVRMEITCGEAPFIVSRYDTTTGEVIDIPERIGILDRKLRVVTENVGVRNPKKWLEWAIVALKGVLAFEWQGDNLLIARENILYTILEYYKYYCHAVVDHATLLELARIVSWNIWQMDGLKFVVPESCHDEVFAPQRPKAVQMDLFAVNEESEPDKQLPLTKPCPGCSRKNPLDGAREHNGIYCNIMDWEESKPIRFVELVRKEKV